MTKIRKGIIYDLDGTIIVTTELHEQGWIEAGKHLNIDISEDFLKNQKGLPEDVSAKQILGEKYDKHGENLIRVKQLHTIQNSRSVRLYADFLSTYQKLSEKGIKVWICTSAPREFVLSVYNNIPELQVLKDKTVFREMYKEGKPNPEPVFLTVKLMGLPVQQCVYIGDAYNDYLAATSAGCEFVYIRPNPKDNDPRIPSTIPVISNHSQILNIIET